MMQEFVQQSKNLIEDLVDQVHTALPGTIVSFDPASGQATVLPVGKFKKPDGKMIDFPPISGVPVIFPQAGGQTATIAYPVRAGDGCLLIIAEQSLDSWMYGGEARTELKFDLTNGIALPGLFVPPNSVVADACGQEAIIIDVSGARITCKQNAVVVTVGNTVMAVSSSGVAITGNVTIKGDLTTSGGTVKLN